MSITRSTGIPVTVGGLPIPCFPLPGGGYEGKTAELDAAVMHCAALLEREFPAFSTVEVRFNSHRESGGAHIPPHSRDDIGLTAGQYTDLNCAVRHGEAKAGDIYYGAYMPPHWYSGDFQNDFERKYLVGRGLDSPEANLAWLLANMKPDILAALRAGRCPRKAPRAHGDKA